MESRDPYKDLPQVPQFAVESEEFTSGCPFAPAQYSARMGVPGGKDASPQLAWSGFPEGTRSFAVTMYDPDAPTASGYWHWAAFNIPAAVTGLAGDAANSGQMPEGTVQLANDAGFAGYVGAAPPAGHGRHHYYVVVHAVDTEELDVAPDASPAALGFALYTHTLGRAVMVGTAEIPAD